MVQLYTSDWDSLIPTNVGLNNLHDVYLALGVIILLYSVASLVLVKRFFVNESIIAIVFGIILGPSVLRIIDPIELFGEDHLVTVMLEGRMLLKPVSRIIVGVCCLNLGIQLPNKYLWKHRVDMFIMLGPVMAVMFTVTSLGVRLTCGTGWVFQTLDSLKVLLLVHV
jgi:NhaP-type Na+/H+ or K+/H+ antiporter